MTTHPPPLPCAPPARPAGANSLLLDTALRVLGAEGGAVALIHAHPAVLSLSNGRLGLPRQQGALTASAQALLAGNGAARQALALHRPGQPPLTLVLERAASPKAGRFWLHLVDGARPQLDAELLRQMFGLTSAEVRIALLLAQGLSSEDMASRLGVQSNTVRGHIKQLLAKAHARRQAQLVGWLWRSAAVVLTPAGGVSTPDPLISGVDPAQMTAHYPDG